MSHDVYHFDPKCTNNLLLKYANNMSKPIISKPLSQALISQPRIPLTMCDFSIVKLPMNSIFM